MSFVNFTKTRPVLSWRPPAAAKVVLLFEATYGGYREAAAWLTANPGREGVFRLVIPYAIGFPDVDDYVAARSEDPVLATEAAYRGDERHFFFTEVGSGKNSLDAYLAAAAYLRERMLLRDVFSGLSAVQEFLRAHQDGLAPEEVAAACAAHFRLPMADVRHQQELMAQGNMPHLNFERGYVPVPLALVNGPYPIAPRSVVEGIVAMMDFGNTTVDWTSKVPGCAGFAFELTTGGWASTYGVPVGHLPNLEPYGRPFRSRAPPPPRIARWDPMFRQGTFDINTYVRTWLEGATTQMGTKRKEMAEAQDMWYLESQVIAAVVLRMTDTDSFGDTIKVFAGESLRGMKDRIDRDYGGHRELLDLPLRRFTNHYAMDNCAAVPECARDMVRDAANAMLADFESK